MTMRRTMFAIVAATSLAAAACGGGDDDQPVAASGVTCPVDALDDVTSPVTIRFWHEMPVANGDTLVALTNAYNASQSKVKVELAYQGTYDEGADKYLTSLRGGDPPELVMIEDTRTQLMIDSKSAIPAQACIAADDYDLGDHYQSALDELTVDGELWPMPFNVSNPVLFYDRRDFVAAGLDPDKPPRTFAEVLAAARKIKASGAAGAGFALDLQPGYVEHWLNMAGENVVDNDNGRSARAERSTFDNATSRQVFEFLAQLVADGAINVGRNPSEADQLLAIGSGAAAMGIGTSAALGSVYAVQAAGQFTDLEVGVGPMPIPDEKATAGVIASGSALYIVGKGQSDQEIAAAWDYAKYLNAPEQQAAWHAGTGYLPIRKSAATAPAVADLWRRLPTYKVGFDQFASATGGGGPVVGPSREVREAVLVAIEKVLLRGEDPARAVTQASAEIDAALDSYNDRVPG
ncbi:MAG: ABC transporter substrate-binding protein [Acidimicrobiia bacterium]